MRSLFLLLIVLAGCSCLRAQKINLSPQEAAGYLANLHVTENRKFINDGTDSLNTIYENAVVSSDTAQMIHAQGWLAYSYYSTRQMQEAIGLARASKALAAEFGMPSTARALAASTLVLAVTNPSTSARAAELKDALTGCVPDSRLEYEVKVMLVHTISAVCAPEVDSLLESLLPFINNGYESLKESRMYQSYYAVKAYYYERCTGDLEQAEVMRRRVMNYYKESKGNRSHFMLYTDAIIRTAALNSRMDRRPEVEELVAVLDTIDLQETAYNGIAYINTASKIKQYKTNRG